MYKNLRIFFIPPIMSGGDVRLESKCRILRDLQQLKISDFINYDMNSGNKFPKTQFVTF